MVYVALLKLIFKQNLSAVDKFPYAKNTAHWITAPPLPTNLIVVVVHWDNVRLKFIIELYRYTL